MVSCFSLRCFEDWLLSVQFSGPRPAHRREWCRCRGLADRPWEEAPPYNWFLWAWRTPARRHCCTTSSSASTCTRSPPWASTVRRWSSTPATPRASPSPSGTSAARTRWGRCGNPTSGSHIFCFILLVFCIVLKANSHVSIVLLYNYYGACVVIWKFVFLSYFSVCFYCVMFLSLSA